MHITQVDKVKKFQKHLEINHQMVTKVEKHGQIAAYNLKQERCTDCNEKFASKDILRMHHEAKHQGVLRYFCEKCNYACYRKDQFEKHTVKLHCTACDSFTTNHQQMLDQHMVLMHTDLAPESNVQMEPKIEIFEPEFEKIETKTEKRRNKKRKYSSDPVECEICQRTFACEEMYVRHKEFVHLKLSKYFCDKCDFKAYYKKNFDNHTSMFHCPFCNYFCKESEKLSDHFKGLHGSEAKVITVKTEDNKVREIHPCYECGKTFDKKGIRSHIQRVHLKSCDFLCDQCEYATIDKRYLLGHKQIYHEEGAKLGRHKCKKCEKLLVTSRTLKRHDEIVHQQIKHHFCEKCDFGSYELRDLTKHVFEYHYDINDHKEYQKCDVCGYVIKTTQLYQHMKAMHDKKMYFCDMCDFSRPYKTQVEKHKERVHEDFSKTVQTYQYFDDDKIENENKL